MLSPRNFVRLDSFLDKKIKNLQLIHIVFQVEFTLIHETENFIETRKTSFN